MKKHNFSAGPSILPQEVMKKASEAVLDFENMGLSIVEISHRSKEFIAVMDKAIALVKELLEVPEGFSVLFLQGGASTEFLMVPYNLLKVNGKAAYVDTGSWSSKAIKEAKKLGDVEVIASSKEKGYNYIPKDLNISDGLDYVHFTSNNTIFGTQIQDFPESNVPFVCDMSSDIFSKKIDFSKFALIYAGAQKNMGPAGTTLVIVKDELLGQTGRDIPSMLDYQIHADKGSMFNTPPVFAVYTSMLTLEWLKANGGIEAIEKINAEKASLIYDELDNNKSFVGFAAKEDRSKMNVTFNLTDESIKAAFDQKCAEAGISGLNGHRSVGGYRASIYNAMPLESVKVLVDIMKQFR